MLGDWKEPEIALAARAVSEGLSAQLNAVDIFQHTTIEFTCLGFENGDNQMAVLQQAYLR